MAIVVQKYGGSSVATTEKLCKIADKIKRDKDAGLELVVVVSAMGGKTDELYELARSVCERPPARELDMLMSVGERITMTLLTMALRERGVDAMSFTGSQSGIITNDRHSDARIIDVRPHRILDELHRNRTVIVAGYQGMSYKREVTTLGRGGSDTTALALAAALGADRAEIYSDVDGIYSADPRKVHGASHLPELNYDEMSEMSVAGAKVLHAQAIEWARREKIPIHARSTFAPGRESIISTEGQAKTQRLVVCDDIVRVRGAKPQAYKILQLEDVTYSFFRNSEQPVEIAKYQVDQDGLAWVHLFGCPAEMLSTQLSHVLANSHAAEIQNQTLSVLVESEHCHELAAELYNLAASFEAKP